jgi:hypothetical protein
MTETLFSLVTPYVIKIYFFTIHIIISSIGIEYYSVMLLQKAPLLDLGRKQ